MNDEIYSNLSELANQLSSMTFILNAYCKNFEEDIKEFDYLVEFSQIMHKTAKDLYKLL